MFPCHQERKTHYWRICSSNFKVSIWYLWFVGWLTAKRVKSFHFYYKWSLRQPEYFWGACKYSWGKLHPETCESISLWCISPQFRNKSPTVKLHTACWSLTSSMLWSHSTALCASPGKEEQEQSKNPAPQEH